MKGKISNQKLSKEYGKKVWLLKNKEGKTIQEFISKANAIKFKDSYYEELKLERLQDSQLKRDNESI